jgi:signal transduction histidine kinase/ligand-binding sensor domain-containing protein/DNA-binding response OmpR family regulator
VKFFLILNLFFSVEFVYGQKVNLRFQHLTSDDGLSQNTVDCILKDSRGFMWFGTWNGLNRFDGYNFVTYKSENKEHSLSDNFIYSLCEDKNGDLWIGTKNGLNRFIYSQNRFIKYFNQKNNKSSVSGNWITSILCDHRGILWVGTANDGLNKFIFNSLYKDSFDVKQIKYVAGKTGLLCDNHINVIYEDREKNLWIGTNNGLIKLNQARNQSEFFFHNPGNPNSLSYNVINTIFEDQYSDIWVGTQYGLNRIDRSRNKFSRYYYDADDPTSISHFVITDIKQDLNGDLLIATLRGLNKYNRETSNFEHFLYSQNDDYSINNEFINSLFVDKQGNVWIGTDKGGVNKYSIYQKQFGYFIHQPANENSLSNNTINSILDEKSTLWIGTAGGGLNKYDKNLKRFTHYISNIHNPGGLNNDFITSICRDKGKTLWVGTWGGGLNKMLPNGSFKKYLPTSNPVSICDVYVSSILEISKGLLLVGNLGGLDLFDPKTEIFHHIANNTQMKKRIVEVGCILQDNKNYIWIGSRLGLFRIAASKLSSNITDNDIDHFTSIPGDLSSLPGDYVISLFQDVEGNVWVGMYGKGLAKVNIQNNKITFTNYSQKDGLSNNVVYAILEDNRNNLWLSTDYGLSRFDVEKNQFKNYYVTDGLQSNQFYWSAATKGNDGKMYFGGIKGLNFFYPDSIKDIANVQDVTLTDFKIFNSSVKIGTWNNKKVILHRVIDQTDLIRLSFRENVFSFEFSALDYFLPEKIEYAYKMEGVDKDWVKVPASRRFANYTNLKGGEYIFEVKASNSDGVWNEKSKRIKIIITPPFYSTIWFKILLFLFLALLTAAYFTYRTRALKLQKRKLEILVHERTAKIEEQKEELRMQAEKLHEYNIQLEKRQELIEGQKTQLESQNAEILDQRDKLIELNKRVQLVNQLKLRFFTNISHEFRTPLTLIIGPIEKMLKTWKGDENVQKTLQLVNRNAQRLLHLINQLMDFRKIETGKLDLKVSKGNLSGFLEEIYSSFQQLAEQRKIEYSFIPETIDEEQWFDHEKIENIVFNLLSNAFKFTPENGKIELKLSYKPKWDIAVVSENIIEPSRHSFQPVAEIKVTDSGIGIPSEHIHQIFNRFYQVNTAENLKLRGSGIGLSLTRELVKAHHGIIIAESEVGKGSVFTLQLPYLESSYSNTERVDQPTVSRDTLNEQVLNLGEELTAENKVNENSVDDLVIENHNDRPLLLIAEDNYDLRSFISVFFKNDYRVLETENGKDAYELAKVENPDMIISDIMMPEMDGLELCSRIKNNIQTSHIPVILLTARTTVENWIEGLETGADDYVPKPFNINILEARVKNIIETRRKLKKLFSHDIVPEPSKITVNSLDEQFLKKAIQVVEQNFSDPEFGVEEFVNKMAVSRSLLHKKLSVLIDQSAGDFITSIRLKKSAQLLKSRSGNVSEIAYQVGFNDPKYFSRIFKKNFGVTPSEFVEV